MHIFFSDKKLKNWKLCTFGIFLWLCTAMHMKKCIIIHLLLGNIRPRIRYRKMQILWSFQEASPLDLHQDSTMELLGSCSTRIHSNVLRNDRRSLHVVPTTWYASQTKKEVWLGGAINRAASLAASLPPRHWIYHRFTSTVCVRVHITQHGRYHQCLWVISSVAMTESSTHKLYHLAFEDTTRQVRRI